MVAKKMNIHMVQEGEECLFLCDEKLIGKGTLFFNSDSVYIENIETIEKGYETAIVEYLCSLPNVSRIYGKTSPSALWFWEKMGAVVNPHDMKKWDGKSNDVFIRFQIRCKV